MKTHGLDLAEVSFSLSLGTQWVLKVHTCMCVAGGQCLWRPKALQEKITREEETKSRAFCATQEQSKVGLQTARVYSTMKWVGLVLQSILLSCHFGCFVCQDLQIFWIRCQRKWKRPFLNTDFPKAKGQTKWICQSARWDSWVWFLVLKVRSSW